MKTFKQLIEEALPEVNELFPWDLEEKLAEDDSILLLDVINPAT